MAKKAAPIFECIECGHESPKWMGRCPACSAWNTFHERKAINLKNTAAPLAAAIAADPEAYRSKPLADVVVESGTRISSGFAEFDRVLGGGFLAGGSVLLGGEPGIGKSTLISQTGAAVAQAGLGPVLYANGEEAAAQVRLRWNRLGLPDRDIHIVASGHLDLVRDAIEEVKPRLILVDSVQTLFDPAYDSPPGSVAQSRYCAYALTEICKQTGAVLCLIAHVTKDGNIAGPKVLEHMVDTVLYFESNEADLRFLRASKNRFGATDELGIFAMGDKGLIEIKDPSGLFLEQRQTAVPAGVAAASVYEGTRVFLVELQALTVPSKAGLSRFFSEKIDQRRASRLAAILEKYVNLRFSDQDVYVHVGGGLRIQDVGIDLPLAMALHSARSGLAIPAGTAIFGELSLAGEVRPIAKLKQRVQAAVDLGIKRLIGPILDDAPAGYIGVRQIGEAVKAVFAN